MSHSSSTAHFERLIGEARAGSLESKEKLLSLSMKAIEGWNCTWTEMLVRHRLSGRDLTQDVLLAASYSFPQFRGETASAWFAWLRTIHKRLIAGLLEQKEPAILSEIRSGDEAPRFAFETLESKELTPGSSVILREPTDRVRCVLSRIDHRLRETLQLWMNDLSLEEQAIEMGLKVHQVRYLRYKALQEFVALWKNLRESA